MYEDVRINLARGDVHYIRQQLGARDITSYSVARQRVEIIVVEILLRGSYPIPCLRNTTALFSIFVTFIAPSLV